MKLKDRNVLITGGASGIGKIMGRIALEKGAKCLIIWDINEQNIAATIKELSAKGSVKGYRVDVGDIEAVHTAYATTVKECGNVDLLINNAGIIKRADAIDVTVAEWDQVIDLNQKLVFFLSQAVAKDWIADQKGGKIINICSMLSYQGGIRVPSYTTSKSGVAGLTRALANEWAIHNINVNAIAPGYMATNNTTQLRNDSNRNDAILERIPAGRWGTPEDMYGAAIFLASDASAYMNGFTIAVDGGWLAR